MIGDSEHGSAESALQTSTKRWRPRLQIRITRTKTRGHAFLRANTRGRESNKSRRWQGGERRYKLFQWKNYPAGGLKGFPVRNNLPRPARDFAWSGSFNSYSTRRWEAELLASFVQLSNVATLFR